MMIKTITPQFLFDENGEKTAVLLSIEQYEQMIEDLDDLATIYNRRNDPSITLDEIVNRLGIADELQLDSQLAH